MNLGNLDNNGYTISIQLSIGGHVKLNLEDTNEGESKMAR